VKYLLLLIPIFSVAFVDALVRKIPNPLLLSMLIIDIAFTIYDCVRAEDNDEIVSIIFRLIVGFFLGLIVCTLPSMLKIPMGAGDIKYSAVIGATVYFMGYFQAMILMALLVAVFYAFLKITKKGNIKTQIPMGPFLSIGTVITMCFPLTRIVGEISLF
ncbi:MAG: prepilin peptidase, partial [Eubacterium sp.]|nr:prepilin peptidase [Eubacterium sp.]